VDSDLKQQEISSLRNRQSDDSEKAAADLSGWLFYLYRHNLACLGSKSKEGSFEPLFSHVIPVFHPCVFYR
jgi:hypothetical protein